MAENLNTAKSTPSQERDQQRQQLDSCNSLPPSADKTDNKTSGNSMTTTTNNSSTNSHRTIRSNNKGARSHQQQQHRHLCASIPSLLDAPTSRTNFYADHINKCINSNYHVGSCCSMIAVPKCFGWGGDVFNNPMNNYFCRCDIAQNVRFENGQSTMQERIYLPDNPTLKIIGRILGPRGNSLRQLEAETRCRIVIRGKGSVKDPEKERRLRGLPGWEHLHEPLHVLITAQHHDQFVCAHLLHYAGHCIKSLMIPRFDAYKKDQLLQLAIINGTYQPRS